MVKVRLIIQSFIPWGIFFVFDDYGTVELNIAIIGALVFIIIANNQSLQRGFILDWGSLLFFFFLFIVVILFHHMWFILNAPLLASYTLAAIAWISIIIKHPLAVQYAKLNVTKELWN